VKTAYTALPFLSNSSPRLTLQPPSSSSHSPPSRAPLTPRHRLHSHPPNSPPTCPNATPPPPLSSRFLPTPLPVPLPKFHNSTKFRTQDFNHSAPVTTSLIVQSTPTRIERVASVERGKENEMEGTAICLEERATGRKALWAEKGKGRKLLGWKMLVHSCRRCWKSRILDRRSSLGFGGPRFCALLTLLPSFLRS
jgi:hypothetical protein